MTELRSEIEIEAPPEAVLTILRDLASYPEWNPFIHRIAGELRDGARVTMEVSLPQGRDHRFEAEVLRADEREVRFRPRLHSAGLLRVEQFFALEAAGERRTRFVHGQNLSGFALRFMHETLTAVARGAVYMNLALKRRAETRP